MRKNILLFLFGGSAYMLCELLFKLLVSHKPASPLMALVGGAAFLAVGGINEYLDWDMPVWLQIFIGTAIITMVEFVSGCILNIWLGLNVWDYSHLPMNILGQICPQFILLWMPLSMAAIYLDDWLRWRLFDEEEPRYKLWW